VDFAATEQSRNANTGQFLVKECHRLWSVTGTKSRVGNNGKRPGASQCGCQEHKDPVTRWIRAKLSTEPLGGRNASQAHRARSDSDSPVDHDDARQDAPLRRRWRLCQQLCTIYASLSKELLPPWGGVEITEHGVQLVAKRRR
jgi:hypothetical protein